MKTEKEVIDQNLALPGEGLRFGLQSTCVARCAAGKHVLRGGLGAMGVGRMWGFTTDAERQDEGFEQLPILSCHGFGLAPLVADLACLCCEHAPTGRRCTKCGVVWHAETGKDPCPGGGRCELREGEPPPSRVETFNKYLVGAQGGFLVLLNPPRGRFSHDDALLLAAYLVSMATETTHTFEEVLEAVGDFGAVAAEALPNNKGKV